MLPIKTNRIVDVSMDPSCFDKWLPAVFETELAAAEEVAGDRIEFSSKYIIIPHTNQRRKPRLIKKLT